MVKLVLAAYLALYVIAVAILGTTVALAQGMVRPRRTQPTVFLG